MDNNELAAEIRRLQADDGIVGAVDRGTGIGASRLRVVLRYLADVLETRGVDAEDPS